MKKLFVVAVLLCVLPVILFGESHPLALGFSNYMRGQASEDMNPPQKAELVNYLREVEFPAELNKLSIENQNTPVSKSELTEKYQAIEFKDSKKLLEELKKHLGDRQKTAKFESKKIENPEVFCGNFDRSIQLMKINRMLMLLARLYGSQKQGLPSSAFIKATIYSATLLMEKTGDLTPDNLNLAYIQMGSPMDVLSNGLDDFSFSKQIAQSVFEVFDKVNESLPDIEYVEKSQRSIIPRFVRNCAGYFGEMIKKGEVNGEIMNEASKETIKKDIQMALDAESKAQALLDGYFSKEVFTLMEKPFSENQFWEQKSKEISDMCLQVMDESNPAWDSDRIAKAWVSSYAFDPRRIAKSFWNSKQRIEGAKTLIALIAYKTEFKKWPESLEALEKWFEKPLGKDLYSGKWMRYDTEKKIIRCDGSDGKPDNQEELYGDDLWVYPIKFE
ncbi:MAG: hypothetical protein KKB51_09380 [Candidatus Riflebacteria bacterium]|nr:hypothetical protein [Candidatus Riflebacteria bacterium]